MHSDNGESFREDFGESSHDDSEDENEDDSVEDNEDDNVDFSASGLAAGLEHIPDEEILPGGSSFRELAVMLLSVLYGHSTTDALKLSIFQCLNIAFNRKVFPETQYQLKKTLAPVLAEADFHLWCTDCEIYIGVIANDKNQQTLRCEKCGRNVKKNLNKGNCFVSNNVTKVLLNIVEKSPIPIENMKEKPSDDADIFMDVSDGTTHKRVQSKEDEAIWTYNFFTDGAPVFANSKNSMWLTFISPNFLPLHLR
jgi:hypothetical protein